jgi:hypothetical protein
VLPAGAQGGAHQPGVRPAKDLTAHFRRPARALTARGGAAPPDPYAADFGSFFQSKRDELEDLLAQNPKVVAVTTTLYLTPLIAKEVVKFVRERSPESCVVVGGPLLDNLSFHLEEADFRVILEDIGGDVYVRQQQGEQT